MDQNAIRIAKLKEELSEIWADFQTVFALDYPRDFSLIQIKEQENKRINEKISKYVPEIKKYGLNLDKFVSDQWANYEIVSNMYEIYSVDTKQPFGVLLDEIFEKGREVREDIAEINNPAFAED